MIQGDLWRFRIIWVGQLVSVLGSGISWFAVTVWAWQTTGSATQFGLLIFCSFASGLLASPLAGALVDRLSRKSVMLVCDTALAGCSAVVLSLYASGQLRVWHLLIVGAVEGVLETFHWLAYAALISDLVPDHQRSRANGLVGLSDPASDVVAPAVAGALLVVVTLGGVLVVDVATYLAATLSLGLVKVPDHRTARSVASAAEPRRRLWSDALLGFGYIRRDRALRGLVGIFFVMNFVGGVAYALNIPLVLLRSGGDTAALGVVVSAGGVGGVVGALVMSVWSGPRRRARFVAGGIALGCAFGPLLMAVSFTAPLWILATFVAALVPPMVNAVHQTIWQGTVPSELQGRVFGARRLITQAALPIGLLGSGPLVDSVLTDAMNTDSVLAPVLGAGGEGAAAAVIGTAAVLGLIGGIVGLLSRALRRLDREREIVGDAKPTGPHSEVSGLTQS